MLSGAVIAAVAVAAVAPPITSITDALLILHFHVAAAKTSHGFHIRSYILAPVFAALSYFKPKGTDIVLPATFFSVDAAYCIWLAAEGKAFTAAAAIALIISTSTLLIEIEKIIRQTQKKNG